MRIKFFDLLWFRHKNKIKGGELKMKLVIHGEKEANEPELNLKLLKDEAGVVVHAVDKKGDLIPGGAIVRIFNNGSIVRPPGLPETLGLQLNPKGQILEKSIKD